MQCCSRVLAVTLALTLVTPIASAPGAATPAPKSPVKNAATTKPDRNDRPSCADLRLSAEQMRAALQRHAETHDDGWSEGPAAFEAIGDELGCRWPDPAVPAGLLNLLERGGGVPARSGTTRSGKMR